MTTLFWQRLTIFFSPPVFPGDEEKTRAAQVLNALQSIYLIILLSTGGLIIPFIVVKKEAVSFFALVLLTSLIGSRYLMRAGKVRLASQCLLITFWVTIMAVSVLGDGLKDMILVFLLAISVMAGLLLGQRFASGMIALTIIFILFLLFLEGQGILPFHYFPKPPVVKWLELTFSLIITGSILHLALRGRENALILAREQLRERQAAEEALRRSDQVYRLIAENVTDVIWTMNLNFQFTYLSPSIIRMRGFTVEEALAQTLPDILTPSSLLVASEAIAEDQLIRVQNPEIADRTLTLQLEEYKKDGSTFWTENEISYLKGEKQEIIGIVGVTRDISEQKRAETALRESEERFRSLIQSSSDLILVVDENGRVTYESPSMELILGYPPGFFIGHSPLSVVHPEDLDQVRRELDEVFRSVNIGIPTVFRCRKADGVWVVLEAVGSNQLQNPSVNGLVLTVRDITQRQAAEKALIESEEQYRALIETTNTGFVILDAAGRVLDANEEYVRLTGYREFEEIRGRSVVEWTADYEKAKNSEALEDCFQAGKIRNLEIDYQDHSGKITTVEINATVVEQKGEPKILSICRDITERKGSENERQKLEERLRRAEKMESLGRLAGGVAHDLNNVLGVLVGYSELLLMDIPEESPLRPHVTNILEAGQRGAAIIQDLLTLARRGVAVSEVVNLNQIFADLKKSPEFENISLNHPNVVFTFDLAKDLLFVRGSPVHLSKTMLNLLVNAAEAISDRGEVRIQTENRYLDRPLQGYDAIEEGDYVAVTISDNGQGIPTKEIGKIFEPFFTKKVMGRSGTGLGLAVVWGTMKDHNGYIDVQSTEGRGTTFTLLFPITREEMSLKEEALPLEAYHGHGETILVVDDIKEQRELARSMLSRMNYQVSTVSSGEDALDYLKSHSADLLVLDMLMDPGWNGLETYQKILEIHPGQKAIIVSGFSDNYRVKMAQDLGAGAYVRKPYVFEKIGVAVKEELDRNTDQGNGPGKK
jgi:PAS domain S-box-containing protein